MLQTVFSCVNQFFPNDFLCRIANIVYPSHSFHLVVGFDLFGHPLRFGHLPGKKLHPVLRGFLHLDKIFLQFAGDQQVGIENSTVFFEIAQPYAVFSDWASFLLRR